MLSELIQYLIDNRINYSNDEDLLYISGKSCMVCGEIGGKVIDDKTWKLLDFDSGYDLYVFKFGGVWYKSKDDNATLDQLQYSGDPLLQLQMTSFLGVHGSMDILSGSRLYPDWVKKAKFLGLDTLGICEHNTLAGAVKFQLACKKGGIKPVIGMSVTVKSNSGDYRVKLFCEDVGGWNNLLKVSKEVSINTVGYVAEEFLHGNNGGLVMIIDPKFSPFKRIQESQINYQWYSIDAAEFVSTNADNEYYNNIAEYVGSKLEPVAAPDAYYLEEGDAYVSGIMNQIAGRVSNNYPTRCWLMSEVEYISEVSKLFRSTKTAERIIYSALSSASNIANQCNFTIEEMSPEARHLPAYKMKPEEIEKYGTPAKMMEVLIEEGLSIKVDESDFSTYRERITQELEVLDLGNVRDYFLILWDIIKWSRSQNIIVGIGRGSAAGSLIAYLMDITRVNPFDYDLLFERFLNPGRVLASLPDIDVDFSGLRRDEVKEYIVERYGEDQFCDVGTYTNLKPKSLVKELGKMEGYEHYQLNEITKYWPNDTESIEDIMKLCSKDKRTKSFVLQNPAIINDCRLLLMQPKAESIHACATIIVPDDKTIYEYIPVKWMIREGKRILVSQWEGPELEATGFLKEDILGVAQLDKYEMILNRIKDDLGEIIDLDAIPLDDPHVMAMFKRGDNSDIFHFGSQGLTQYCKEMKPDDIHDLIAANSLYRPGPMEQGYHKQYIKRKAGIEEVEYLPECEQITKHTYGLLAYQEQIMLICQHVGGLTLTEADSIRKAMVKKDINAIGKFVEKFKNHAVDFHGLDIEGVDDLWEKLLSFAKYGFNRCIVGDEKLLRFRNGNGFEPTISEMYKIRNDVQYARSIGKYALHQKFKHKGFGKSYSLIDGKLKLNKVVDIRFEGVQPVFKINLKNGSSIKTTINHKFPTNNGMKMVKDFVIGKDELFVNAGYIQDRYMDGILMGDGIQNSEKGHEGFTSKESLSTDFLKFKHFKDNLKSVRCELCDAKDCRLEVHHKDGNHATNNEPENLATLCVSCHKKEHYKMGRTVTGQKGLAVETSLIISIDFCGDEDVYDVEMAAPSHTFTTKSGVVTCNSHAAAYSITAYYGQWLKCYYPLQFWATAFSFAKEDNYPIFLAEIFRGDGLKMNPPHINISGESVVADKTSGDMYWSMKGVKGCGEKAYEQIVLERDTNGAYSSFGDFLARNIWKANKKEGVEGSKVTKTTIESLIASGAFDSLEDIQFPSERKLLLDTYRELKKVKVDAEKDYYSSDLIGEDWYWGIRQKQLCGIAKFDYSDLAINHFSQPIFTPPEDLDLLHEGEWTTVLGYVTQVIERKTRKGDTMLSVELEHNFAPIFLTIWPNHYKEYKHLFDNAVGKIMCISGEAKLDTYSDQTKIYSSSGGDISVL